MYHRSNLGFFTSQSKLFSSASAQHLLTRRPARRTTRYRVRRHRQIKHGDVLTDMCIAVLFYPLALVQHEKELRAPDDSYGASLDKESEEKEA